MPNKTKNIEVSDEKSHEGTLIFASYHYTTLDAKYNGFGNFMGYFHMDAYTKQPGKFVQDLEKSVMLALEAQLGLKTQVKVLYFR